MYLLTQFVQEVRFANNAGFSTYRLTFSNYKGGSGQGSMQLGEIELLGVATNILSAIVPSTAMTLIKMPVRDPSEIEAAIKTFAREPNGGLMVMPEPYFPVHRKLIVELAARYHLPTIYPFRSFTADGGLMSYSVEVVDLYRRAAGYVDRILKGSPVADMPVQQPTKYELVINLKTARTLGLEVPPSLLARADEVIE